MKRYGAIAISLVLALAVSSCALTGNGVGRVRIPVPRELLVDSRSLVAANGKALDSRTELRVYVEQNGVILPGADGNKYSPYQVYPEEAAAEKGEILLELPAASGYRILVAIGYYENPADNNSPWTTTWWGGTGTFRISYGAFTAGVTLYAEANPFTTVSRNAAVTAVVGGKLYSLTGNALYENGTKIADPGANGITAVSMSTGLWFKEGGYAEELWLNTEGQGIVPYRSGNFVTGFSKPDFAKGALYTGALVLDVGSAGSPEYNFVVYSIGKGRDIRIAHAKTASAVPSAGIVTWDAIDVPSEIAKDTTLSGAFDNITGDLVYSFDLVRNADNSTAYAYISSAAGIFRYGADVMPDIKKNTDGKTKSEVTSWAVGFLTNNPYTANVYVNNESVKIGSVALDGADRLYAGTEKGLFWTALDSGGKPASGTQIKEQAGTRAVRALAARSFGAASYAAILDSFGDLYLFKDGVKSGYYPFYSGFAEGSTALRFYGDSASGLYLSLSGSAGISTLAVK